MVHEVMTYLDQLESEAAKIELIETLRAVTEGKIFVELERARLTQSLCAIKEAAGNIKEACDILNEVQIETVQSMERREKAEFVLEQMRLLLDNSDYARTSIVSKKLSKKVLQDDSFEDVKIKFNEYMIRYHDSKDNYMDMFRCYNGIYNTSIVKNDPEKLAPILKAATSFLVLAPHDNEQNDFLHRIKDDANLEKFPSYLQLYKLMTTRVTNTALGHPLQCPITASRADSVLTGADCVVSNRGRPEGRCECLAQIQNGPSSDLVSAVVRRGGLQWGQWRQAMECVQGQDYRVQYSYHRNVLRSHDNQQVD
jgi:hypothetical protein